MKKNSKLKITAITTAVAASSIALSLHFYSLQTDLKEVQNSYEKLNEKYNRVLTENEELHSEVNALQDAVEESLRLLEQSQMEIERLEKEKKNLNKEKEILKGEREKLKKELSKKDSVSTVQVTSTSSSNDSNWETFKLTYYDNNEQSTGKRPGDPAYGITASGRPTKEGVSIAVDPNIIPLDSWVLIKWPDGRIEKRRADDTGSAIKGSKIDYYVPKATLAMGVKNVQVKVLSEG